MVHITFTADNDDGEMSPGYHYQIKQIVDIGRS